MTKWLRENLWRHITGWIMCAFAVFPLYLVLLSAFNESGSLQVTSFLPREISFANFDVLFNDERIPYLTWMKNSLMISGFVAIVSVIIGAASAFAGPRFCASADSEKSI